MQATAASFPSASHAGTVLDGTELLLDGDAFDDSGVRLLRAGRRVAIRMDDQRVVTLNLATLPLP